MLLRALVAILTDGLVLEAVAAPAAGNATPENRVIPKTHELHERHAPHVAQKWTKRSKPNNDIVLPMRIGLKQSNLGAGHDKLMDMYVLYTSYPMW